MVSNPNRDKKPHTHNILYKSVDGYVKYNFSHKKMHTLAPVGGLAGTPMIH